MTLRELLEQITQRASQQGLMDKPVYLPEDPEWATAPERIVDFRLSTYVETVETQMLRTDLRASQTGTRSFAPIDGVVLQLESR